MQARPCRSVLGAAYTELGRLLAGRQRRLLLGCGFRWPVGATPPSRTKGGSASLRPSLRPSPSRAVDGFAPQGAREVDKLAARGDGRAGIVGIAVDRVGIVEARVGDIQNLAADGTTALLLGQQLLAPLEVDRDG